MARPNEFGKGSRLIVLASVCVVIGALYFAREVLIPLALSVLLSFLLTPAVRWLERLRFPRAAAVLVVVAISVAVIGSIGYLVERQVATIINDLPNYREQLSSKVGRFKQHGGMFRKAEAEFQAIGSTPTTAPTSQPGATREAAQPPAGAHSAGAEHPAASEPARSATQQASSPATQPSEENPLPVRVIPRPPTSVEVVMQWAGKILDPLATAGLVLVFVIFMMLNREDLRDRLIRLVGHGQLNLTTQASDEASTRISKYLSSLAIVNGAYGVATTVGLWLIGHFLGKGHGFPNVLVWGILVGLFRFVPYIGIWIGAAFPLLLSFALFSGNAAFFATLGLFGVLEVVVSQFVEPFWYGASTGMSALAVLVSAVFWTWLWGPVGLLLSTPLTVCLVVIGKYVPQLKFIDILLRDEPVLQPHVRVYQRLIADDTEEATELAHTYLTDRTLEQVFDQVLMPALSLAVQDRHHRRLEADRFNIVLQGMREITEELSDREKAVRVQEQAAATVDAAKNGSAAPSERPAVRLPRLPADCGINILCLPARDEADEIVALMLSQLLENRGYCTTSTTSAPLAGEMAEMVEKTKADIVCVSAMPPAAISHARYLCKRLHAGRDDLRMVIGLWMMKSDLKRAKERISCNDGVQLVVTLADAQDQIEQLAHPLVVKANTPRQDATVVAESGAAAGTATGAGDGKSRIED